VTTDIKIHDEKVEISEILMILPFNPRKFCRPFFAVCDSNMWLHHCRL